MVEITMLPAEGPGGAKGAICPPSPTLLKLVIKKIVTECGRIDFMFLGPSLTNPLDSILAAQWNIR